MKPYFSILLCATLALSACSGRTPFLYRVDIAQGNLYRQSDVEQIRPGMIRAQVHRLLGPPLLADPFYTDRDNYVYRLTSGKTGRTYRRDLTIYYDRDDRIIDIQQTQLTAEEH